MLRAAEGTGSLLPRGAAQDTQLCRLWAPGAHSPLSLLCSQPVMRGAIPVAPARCVLNQDDPGRGTLESVVGES